MENPAALQRMWQATLASLKRSKAAYGVLFLGTKAVWNAQSNMLSIEFPKENAFAFKAVQKPDVQEAVAAALSQACGGQNVPFAYQQAGAAPAPAAAAPVARAVAPRPQASAPAAPRPQAAPVSQQRPMAPRPQAAPAPAVTTPPWKDDQVPYGDFDAPMPEDELLNAPAGPVPRAAAPRPASRPQAGATTQRPAPPVAASVRPQAPAQSASRPAAPQALAPEPRSQAASAAQPAPQPVSPGAAQTPDELQAILQAGFGGDVTFEEVKD